MEINIRTKTVNYMLEIIRYSNRNETLANLEELFEHEDYKLEFMRYENKGIEINDVVQMFMNLLNVSDTKVSNERIKLRCAQLESFIKDVRNNKHIIIDDNFLMKCSLEAVKRAQAGLIDKYTIPNLEILVTIGIGNTAGWFCDNVVHIDVVQFLNPVDEEAIISVMSHEIHHIAMMKFYRELWQKEMSIKDRFLTAFAGEGLAVKYCNNACGFISNSIYDSQSHIGLDTSDFEYFSETFDEMFERFKLQLKMINDGKIIDKAELSLHMKYWTSIDKKHFFNHTRIYYFGSELWGLLHDAFGVEKVFELLHNTDEFEAYFNQALISIKRKDLMI